MELTISTRKLLGTVEANLREFAESLKAPEGYTQQGKQMVDKVGRMLQQHSHYSIARRLVGGSVGKNTDVIAPDFDIVIVVNNQEPPFEDVLGDFRGILLRNASYLKIISSSIKMSGKCCVQFTFTNQIDVDLLVGANLPLAEIRSRMLSAPERSRIYSTSLVEEAKAFMESQDTFTHSLVRLGKFWFRSLHFGDKVRGGRTIIELVCVAAALKEKGKSNPSMFRAFSHVIDMFTRLSYLKLAFQRSRSSGDWETIPIDVLNTKSVRFGDWGYCNRSALSKDCFILEAVNPLNNLLASMEPEMFRKFKKFAYKTKTRLQDLMSGKTLTYSGGSQYSIQFEKLFEPQPVNLLVALELEEAPYFLVSYCDPWSSSISPGLEVRNPDVMQYPEVETTLYVMKQKLMTIVHSLVRGSPSATNEDVISSTIEEMIEKSFQKGLVDARDDEKHEDYDVTITIPYSINNESCAARFSLNWRREDSDSENEEYSEEDSDSENGDSSEEDEHSGSESENSEDETGESDESYSENESCEEDDEVFVSASNYYRYYEEDDD